jgi:hypothetical protein
MQTLFLLVKHSTIFYKKMGLTLQANGAIDVAMTADTRIYTNRL